MPPTVKLAGAAFGRDKAPLVFSWIFTAHQMGGAVAALGGGMSRDALASYLPAFFVAGAACLLARYWRSAPGPGRGRPRSPRDPEFASTHMKL